MNPFTLVRPRSHDEAARVMASGDYRLPMLKAGGLDVVDHLKEGLIEPDALVDVRRTRRDGRDPVSLDGGGTADARLVVEAATTLAELAESDLVRTHAPALADAAGSAATPHVRSVASTAGNLLQRPRCWYYRYDQFDCLKKGGDRCYAADGENAHHAIFAGSGCHIVHPSNLAVALSVHDATVHVVGGERDTIAIADLFVPPSRGVRREHVLEPGEVVTHVTLRPGRDGAFLALKHKQSFDWPMVAAAANIRLDAGRILEARVCAGAVAPIPWRLPAVEAALAGVDPRDDAALAAACASAAEGARPLAQNGYKVTLLPVVVRRAIRLAAGLPAVEGA